MNNNESINQLNRNSLSAVAEDFIGDMETMISIAASNSKNKGFWQKDGGICEDIALAHAELSEALQNEREGRIPDKHLPQYSGIEVELADLVIYVMVMAKRRGLRIPEAIVDKMRFNTTREFMHGRKF